MEFKNIPSKSKEVIDRVTDEMEKKGKAVVERVTSLTEQKAEEITEKAILTAVDNAIDVIKVASKRVKEKGIENERVSLEVEVGIANVAQLKIKTDVLQTKDNFDRVSLELR
ncbi:MAG: hypothetical protein ACFBSE_01890 [Prochloraceae cyanobacterium]